MEKPTSLVSLIGEIDCLRGELGIARWSFLKAWCDGGVMPRDADEGALWRLLERLCKVWEDRNA